MEKLACERLRRHACTGAIRLLLHGGGWARPKMDAYRTKRQSIMNDEPMIDDGCGWAVAGVLTELQGAVLTTSVGDGGLAGRLELVEPLATAANENRFERFEGELG